MTLLLALVALRSSLVTVITPTADVPHVMEVVSEVTGVKHAAPGFEREFLTLHVTDVDPQELRTKIAFVLDAEWKKVGDDYLLVRDASLIRLLEERDQDALVKSLQSEIDGFRTLADLPSDDEFIESSLNSDPIGWLKNYYANLRFLEIGLEEVIRGFDFKMLVSLPINEPIVFAENPTGAQRRLPKNVVTAIQEIRRASLRIQSAVPSYEGSESLHYPNAIRLTRSGDQTLIVQWYSYRPPQVTERIQAPSLASINYKYLSVAAPQSEAEGLLQGPDLGRDVPIQFDRGDRAVLAQGSHIWTQRFNDGFFTPDLLDEVATREPYSFVWDSAVGAAAIHGDYDIVAVPDLELWTSFLHYLSDHNKTSRYALQWVDLSSTKDGQMRLIKPWLSVALRAPEENRNATETLLRESLIHQKYTISPCSRFLAECGTPALETVTSMIQYRLSQQGVANLFMEEDLEGESGDYFLGGLSNDIVSVLQSGQRIRLGDLSAKAQGTAYNWALISGLSHPGETADDFGENYDTTVVYPRALPPDTTISYSSRLNRAYCVLFRLPDGREEWRFMNESAVAGYFFAPKNGILVVGFHPCSLRVDNYLLETPDGLEVGTFELLPECSLQHKALRYDELEPRLSELLKRSYDRQVESQTQRTSP